MKRPAQLLRVALPPLLTFVLLLTAWQAAVLAFNIPPYRLPSPYDVLTSARDHFKALARATALTGAAALCGLLASCVLGTLLAFLFAQSRLIRRSLFPYAIFLQTVPIVAIAPLVIVWCGYGFTSVVVISTIISLFPIITNGTHGLTALDPQHVSLFRLYGATRWQTLIKLRLPTALPFFITGARISSGLAVIGAIVGEFFAGLGAEGQGLGYLINYTNGQLQIDFLFAAVAASTLLGLAIFTTLGLIGAFLLRRRPK